MSTCGCTGKCKSPPYTCGGFETQEEIESYTQSRYKALNLKEKKKCENCGCELKEQQELILES